MIRKSRRTKRGRGSPKAACWESAERIGADDGPQRSKGLWIVVFAAAILAAATASLYWKPFSRQAMPSPPLQPPAGELVESVAPPAAQPLGPSEKSERCTALLMSFINAPDHATRCGFVFGRLAMRDILERHYSENGHSLPRRVINPAVSAVAIQDREIIIVSFFDENGKAKAAPFEWDGDEYRLHWEAFAGYGEIAWQQFFDLRPEGEYAMRANLFIPENAEIREGGITALLSHPDLTAPRFVTLPAGSDAYLQITGCPPATDVPALIGIQWPEDGDTDLPVVSRWIHRDWIGL